jgi:hypothetical protein
MKTLKLVILGALAGFASQAALAFQETTAGAGKPGAAPQAVQPQFPGANMTITPPARQTGPEIKVPGLGTIGALPKLDFGLELLYGVGEPKGAREELSKDQNDLQIRGTLKYRFNN